MKYVSVHRSNPAERNALTERLIPRDVSSQRGTPRTPLVRRSRDTRDGEIRLNAIEIQTTFNQRV
jgi:hypothetical protein